MKKFILIGVGIIVLAIVVIAILFIKSKSTIKWKVYENSRYNFSVNYPSGWSLGQEPANQDGRIFSSPKKDIECRAYGFANALTNNQNKQQSLNEYADWTIGAANAQVISRSETKLANNNAIRLVTSENNLIYEQIFALGNESGRGLVCTFNDRESQEKFEKTFDEMVNSFQIKETLD